MNSSGESTSTLSCGTQRATTNEKKPGANLPIALEPNARHGLHGSSRQPILPTNPHYRRSFRNLLHGQKTKRMKRGLARRALERVPRLSEKVQAQVGLARAEALVRSARAYWYGEVETGWDAAVRGCALSLENRAALRIASLLAVEHSVAAADLLYRLAGSSAIFQSCPLERCWRDVHTAAQHVQVQDGRWETAGRVLMGLDPGSPLL